MHNDHHASEARFTLLYALVLGVIVALYRLLPYYVLEPGTNLLWNLVPMGALSLFLGSRLRSPWAYLLPLAAMFVADLLLIRPLAALGFDSFSERTPIVYASFAFYVLVGRLIRERELSPLVIGMAAVLASVQFFVLTNFATWLSGAMFPRTMAGLLECYAFALPFYRNTLAGDLFFGAMIFGLHAGLIRLLASRTMLVPALDQAAPDAAKPEQMTA